MSLTSELGRRESVTRQFFETNYPRLAAVKADVRKRVGDLTTIRPADAGSSYPYMTVGIAIDYRLRLCFSASAELPRRWELYSAHPNIPFAPVISPELPRPLVAELGASMNPVPTDYPYGDGWQLTASRFFGELATLLDRAAPHQGMPNDDDEERLCKFCYVLGLYEELGRSIAARARSPLVSLSAAASGDADVDTLLALCPAAVVADLRAMTAAFVRSQPTLLAGQTDLNPIFAGSSDVGGADGDLVVGSCYLDIKATINPDRISKSEWPWQLLGYALLDYDNTYQLDSLGLYLARQATLVSWSLNEYVTLLGADGAFVPIDAARRAFRSWLAAHRPAA